MDTAGDPPSDKESSPPAAAEADPSLLTVADEAAVVRSIQSFHAPDGIEYAYDSKYVLNIIEDIIIRKIALDERLDELCAENLMKEYTMYDLRDELAYPVHKISAELTWHCHSDGDGRKVSEKIFQSLAPYAWEAKVVIFLAAFTIQYGEFWLVADLYRTTHPVAGSVSMEIPETMGNIEIFGLKFKAIKDLVAAMLDVTRSIVELNEMCNKHHILRDADDNNSATLHLPVIPTACYWVIKSIVACSSILLNLMAMGHQYLTSQVNRELESLGHKLSEIKGPLEEQWGKYQLKLDERKQLDLYLALKRIFGTSNYDNLIGIKALINNKDERYPLHDGNVAMKSPISLYNTIVLTSLGPIQRQLEVLKRKNVILLVSHLDIPPVELEIILQLYYESRLHPESQVDSRIEMVWVPIINRTVGSQDDPILKSRYHEIQKNMPCYSVSDPFMVEPGAIRFIREEWKFEEKPILVVLDRRGRVSNYDATDMYWIWGFEAAPFDEARERELWTDARWSMDLLIGIIDPNVHSWLASNKYVCVFGGDNIDWIRKFTTMARGVARQLEIPLELFYVGKSNSKEFARRNKDIIITENLTHVWPNELLTWFFWERLKCMWNSREKLGLPTVNDVLMQKIISVLIYDNSDRPWAVFGSGQYYEMAMQEGELVYEVLEDFTFWKDNLSHNNFVKVLDDVFRYRRPKNICWRVVYPGVSARAPTHIEWPECEKPMEKQIIYQLCSD